MNPLPCIINIDQLKFKFKNILCKRIPKKQGSTKKFHRIWFSSIWIQIKIVDKWFDTNNFYEIGVVSWAVCICLTLSNKHVNSHFGYTLFIFHSTSFAYLFSFQVLFIHPFQTQREKKTIQSIYLFFVWLIFFFFSYGVYFDFRFLFQMSYKMFFILWYFFLMCVT